MPDLSTAASAAPRSAEVRELADAATAADGVAPFNEDTLLSLGERRLTAINDSGRLIAAALTRDLDDGTVEGELVVHPEHRRRGLGGELSDAVTGEAAPVFWAHGNLAGAVALASSRGLDAVRTLLKLGRPLTAADAETVSAPDGYSISPFAPDDADDFLALNAIVFRSHPEQGALDAPGLQARQSTDWFNADDFLLLRDADGTLLGYNWLKREGDEVEIYVVGIAPQAAGRGLGRALMQAGLERMHSTGAKRTSLYVEGDNDAALSLYRSLGYEQLSIDVQYRRNRS
ncbi:mycothiol synthase [Pseudoclavibacter sp. VKM Ac-2867]|uniref:mycothiol synthase n=1 Tax=Pseudoclavibacter sp. VKM Ac-2867 TaxID=2783829 RepID=UPI00188BFD4C|nr:mycothiol synthase [Pseudoclavibacter sp. VKM Ac-2867]MBF4457697.1 mycothiol synthase [Pseudoclavibacter sp. VKM Ac-2867]